MASAIECTMRRTLLPLLAVLIASPAFATRDLTSIPSDMRGTWDLSYQSCRLATDDSRVTVENYKVTLGVSLYEPDHIMPLGSDPADGIRIDAEVHEEGEQDATRGSIELKLLDPTRLSIKTDLLSDTYVNCKDAQ